MVRFSSFPFRSTPTCLFCFGPFDGGRCGLHDVLTRWLLWHQWSLSYSTYSLVLFFFWCFVKRRSTFGRQQIRTVPSHLLNLSSSFFVLSFTFPLPILLPSNTYTGIQNMNDLTVCEIIPHQTWLVVWHETVNKKNQNKKKKKKKRSDDRWIW
jgi:hypothetical protein